MKKVSREIYINEFKKHKLKPISSFSDPDGILPFGYGIPAMDTDWGIEGSEKIIARCEMRKNNSQEENWEYTYYINS